MPHDPEFPPQFHPALRPAGVATETFAEKVAREQYEVGPPKELSKLDDMGAEELRALVRRISGARWGEIGLMSVDELLEAAKLKLWHGGLTETQIFRALPVLREVMDREVGKPSQSIAMTVEDKGLGKLSDERLLRLERELSRMTGSEALVIAPMPERLGGSE